MWKVKDKNIHPGEIRAKLLSMKGKIPALREFEVGIDFNGSAMAYDLVLISIHESRIELEQYQNDPIHQAVSAYVRERIVSRAVVDFEF
jgi:hypothetical protein